MSSTQDFLDSAGGDSHEAVKFETIGDAVKGTIIDEPKPFAGKNFNGEPEQQLPINLDTADGPRTLWLAESKRALVKAVNKAVKESGAPGLQVGGTLVVQFTETVETKFPQPAKLYRAKYTAAPTSGVKVSDVFDEEII